MAAVNNDTMSSDKEELLHILNDMFKDAVDRNVIEAVAESCNWNGSNSIEVLLDVVNLSSHSNTASAVSKTGSTNSNLEAIGMVDDDDVVIENEQEFEIMDGATYYNAVSPIKYSISMGITATGIGHNDIDTLYRTDRQECSSNVNKSVVPEPSYVDICGRQPSKFEFTEMNMKENKNTIDIDKIGSNRIVQLMLDKSRIMVLLRGCPGSGKSYLAKSILQSVLVGVNCMDFIFSTDEYFTDCKGKYIYRQNELSNAHEWNRRHVKEKVCKGWSPIFVDNTNIEAWEMLPYLELAVRFGYAVELLEPTTPWKYNAKELARRNVHGVPFKKIQSMLERFQKFSSVEQLLNICKLHYPASCKPPQPANNYYITVNSTQLKISKLSKKPKRRKHLNEKNQDITSNQYTKLDIIHNTSDGISQDEQFKSCISNSNTIEDNNLHEYDIENENLIYFSDEEHNEMEMFNFEDHQIAEISKTDSTLLNSLFQNSEIADPVIYSSSSLPSITNDNVITEVHGNDKMHEVQKCDPVKNDDPVNVVQELTKSELNCYQLHEHNENCMSTVDSITVPESIINSDKCPSVSNQCDVSNKISDESVIDHDKAEESNIASSVPDTYIAQELVGKQLFNLQENKSDCSIETSYVQSDILPSLFSDNWKEIPRQNLVRILTQVNDDGDDDSCSIDDPTDTHCVDVYGDNKNYKSHNSHDKSMSHTITCPVNPVNSIKDNNKFTASELTVTDSDLTHWEEGATWDGQPQEMYSLKNNEDPSLPKPERKLRRDRPAIPFTHESPDEESTLEEEDPWTTVSDPISSWDNSNLSEAQDNKNIKPTILPQPQRMLFNEDEKNDTVQNIVDDEPTIFISGDISNETINQNFNTKSITSVKNASTNTIAYDFVIFQNVNSNIPVNSGDSEFTLLTVRNNFCQPDKNSVSSKIPHILMLDKGSMTEDDYHAAVSDKDLTFGQKLRQLIQHFPDASCDVIQDILQKCNGDLNWAADILIESDYIINESHVSVSELSTFSPDEDDDADDGKYNESNKTENDGDKPVVENLETVAVKNEDNEHSKMSNYNHRSSNLDRNLELKKEIEQKFEIDNAHYSEHILRIRKIKHGEYNFVGYNPLTESNSIDVHSQSSSLMSNFNNETLYPFEQTVPNSETVENIRLSILNDEDKLTQATESSVVEIFSQGDSNSDSPESDTQNVNDSRRLLPDDVPESTVAEDKITVPITLDRDSVNRLQGLFGHPAFSFPSDITPQLNVPLSVARFLYCALIEVREEHYQRISDEDEILARKLQEREHLSEGDNPIVEVPTLSEIMDSEMALNLHKHDQDKWKSEIKYDMATKMTINKLYNEFPRVDKDTVCEIFHSYGNCYNDTRDVLLASTVDEDRQEPNTPSESAAYEAELLEQAKKNIVEYMKSNEQPRTVNRSMNPVEEHMHYFNYYRDLASEYRNKQAYYTQQAQKMFRQGYAQVGSYYIQEISHLKEKIDAANVAAVSHLITSNNLQMKNTTLDLHYLYVAEALQVLDIFLDTHINHLRELGQRRIVVYIITGYGSRSVTKPRIKPAAIQRLQQRYLTFRCHKSNPGLLDVVLKKNSVISTEIQKKV